MNRRFLGGAVALMVAVIGIVPVVTAGRSEAAGTAPKASIGVAQRKATPRIAIRVIAPRGVAATVSLKRRSRTVTVAKPPSGARVLVTRRVSAGTWSVSAAPILVGGRYFAARTKRIAVKAGRLNRLTVRYRAVTGLATDMTVTGVSATSASLRWRKAARGAAVTLRRSLGNVSPATVRAGSAVRAGTTAATDRSLRPGRTYSYALFTRHRRGWLRSAVRTVATPGAGNDAMTFVAAAEALMPTGGQVAQGERRSNGRFAVTLSGVAPRMGQAVMVPRSRHAPYGFIGEVERIETDGTSVLRQVPIDRIFDVLNVSIPAAAPSARVRARGKHQARFFDRWGSFSQKGCSAPAGADDRDSAGGSADLSLDKSFEMGPLTMTLKKKDVKFFPDIPYGFEVDGEVSLDVEVSAGFSFESSRECAWTTPAVYVPVGPLPLSLGVNGRLTASIEGGVSVTGLGFATAVTQKFGATLNVLHPSSSRVRGDQERGIEAMRPSVSVDGSITVGVGLDVTFGLGGGTSPLGAIAGIRGTLTPLAIGVEASAEVGAAETPGVEANLCLQAHVGGSVALALVGSAWVSGATFEKTFNLPPGPLTWDYLDYVPDLADALVWCLKGPPQIKTRWLSAGEVGRAYSQKLTLADERTGGWSIEGGLPAGLVLDEKTGVISGTPTVVGETTFVAVFTEGNHDRGTRELTLTVKAPPPPPAITTTELDEGVVDTSYADQLRVSDRRPGTYGVVDGVLPPGISLDPGSGVLSGKPTAEGTTSFSVRFTDETAQSDTQELSITVNPDVRCEEASACVTIGGRIDVGMPVAGAEVTLISPWGDEVAASTTDAQGQYRMRAKPVPGDLAYSVQMSPAKPTLANCHYWHTVTRKARTTSDLSAPGARELDLNLILAEAVSSPCGGPLTPGGSQGDPHLTTFDGGRYEFHAQGEYVVARSTVDDDFEIRFRFRRPAGSNVAWNGGAAARVGDSVITFGDKDPHTARGQLVATLDGAALPISADPLELPGGATVRLDGLARVVTWSDGTELRVADDGSGNDSTTYTVSPSAARVGTLEGLLGNADGDPGNDLVLDGQSVDVWSVDSLYKTWGSQWKVPQKQSWFRAVLPEVVPGEVVTLASLGASAVAAAQTACAEAGVTVPGAVERCVFDVASTGNQTLARSYALTQQGLVGTSSASVLTGTSDQGEWVSGEWRSVHLDAGASPTWSITLTEGQVVHVSVASCPHPGTQQVVVVTPSGRVLQSVEGSACGSFLIDGAPETGRYELRLSDSGGYSGDVRATVFVAERALAASAVGDAWTAPGAQGAAVAALNAKECAAVDTFGNCTTAGLWPVLPGASWIWASDQPAGRQSATFRRSVSGPGSSPRTCQLHLGIDGTTATVTLNGADLGVGPSWQQISVVEIVLQPGENQLVLSVDNGNSPSVNDPAGLIWKIDSCAEPAHIDAVSAFEAGQTPSSPIVISGTGFGPASVAADGTSEFLRLAEHAGSPGYWQACGPSAVVGCRLRWASDGTRITVDGFDEDWGTHSSWTFEDGDSVTITVSNTHGGGSDSCVVVVGAGPTDCR